MKSLLKILFVIINIAVGLALLSSAFSGLFNPQLHPRLVIAAMSFPIWAVLSLVVFILDFFVYRRLCIILGICIAVTLPFIFTVLPLNFPRGEINENRYPQSWSLLTYNVSNFTDLTEQYPDSTNPTVNYILKTDADVVVLEEAYALVKYAPTRITQELLDSVHRQYPYVIIGNDITLLSKFPADSVSLKEFPGQMYEGTRKNSKVACFMVDIHGHKTAIFGVHLKSLGLTREDKNLYEEFTRGEGLTSRSELRGAKNDLIGKIALANADRANQIHALVNAIDSLNFENTIVCGDFNDTPGCFSLQSLTSIGLREVYPLVGTGYMYTFNSDRLLFQIDHVLFKGNFRPWSMKRGNIQYSDHYPLYTTFVTDN